MGTKSSGCLETGAFSLHLVGSGKPLERRHWSSALSLGLVCLQGKATFLRKNQIKKKWEGSWVLLEYKGILWKQRAGPSPWERESRRDPRSPHCQHLLCSSLLGFLSAHDPTQVSSEPRGPPLPAPVKMTRPAWVSCPFLVQFSLAREEGYLVQRGHISPIRAGS